MYVVIGPGAMAIYSFLGAISALGLDSIEEVSGSSAGAILGFFICAGKTLDEITELCFQVNLKELSKVNLMSMITKYGMISLEPIRKVLKEFCGDLKFRDLSKKLHVTTFCVNKAETEYFSVDNAPDMSVIDAVCMSIAVPFLFESVKHNTYTYIDGASREAVPDLAFINKEPSKVLIIKRERHTACRPEICSIKDFIVALVNIAVESAVTNTSLFKTIKVDLSSFDLLNFSMDYEDKMKLYTQGYQTALRHL
jgi:predicted acylesterase/phospholipase RssA